LATNALVIRDGNEIQIPSHDIVPGDLVIISAGQFFPADGIIVAGDALQVDESMLTGESYPVKKKKLTIFPVNRKINHYCESSLYWLRSSSLSTGFWDYRYDFKRRDPGSCCLTRRNSDSIYLFLRFRCISFSAKKSLSATRGFR
jgi:Ca2+-transporting ATPase